MNSDHPSLLTRLFRRVFPQTPDFFSMLTEEAQQVAHATGTLVEFMESGDPATGERIKQQEHEADHTKARNLHALNEAFSTPIDREDLYRAIVELDEIVNYCKTTVYEMDELELKPDKACLEMAMHIKLGCDALAHGFAKLAREPARAATDADAARKAERKVERAYRVALGQLFRGDDYLHMFKRREIYRHLSNAADRMAICANTLHDIVVKTC